MEFGTAPFTLSLLGDVVFARAGTPLDLGLSKTSLAVLGYVAIFGTEPLRRDRIAFALWPDDPEADARAALRRQLYLIGRALPQSAEPWLLLDGRTVRWNPAGPGALDLGAFSAGVDVPQTRAAALALYRGELLAQVDAEWLEEPRARYRERFFDGALAEARVALDAGEPQRAAGLAQRVLAFDPWREDAVRMTLESRAASGDRAGALAFYRDFAARLRADLDAAPMVQTREIFEAIGSDASSASAAPVRPTAATAKAPIPTYLSLFVNREREFAELVETLERKRVVTLTGPGGVGKSRLASAVATHFANDVDVVFVQLAPATNDRRSIENRFLEGFGLSVSDGSVVDAIARIVGSKRTLVFADNADRVTEAFGAVLQDLVARSSGVRLIVTSQQRLRIEGEQIFRLQPLDVPAWKSDVDDIMRSEAVRLFFDRARSLDATLEIPQQHLQHVASICRSLDGMPLPIELAAARTNVLTLPEIDSRLTDRFSFLRSKNVDRNVRHRTLETTLDWSFELLEECEAAAFRRLGVFADGWSLEAAACVFGFGRGDDGDVLDAIDGLIEKSLVTVVPGPRRRYRFLESIRLYATRRLDESDECREIRSRAFEYYRAFVADRVSSLSTPSEKTVFDELALEHENILGVLDHAILGGDIARAAESACDLTQFWIHRGYASAAQSRLDRIVERDLALAEPLRAKLRNASSVVKFRSGNVIAAEKLAVEALDLAQSAGDVERAADALLCLARCKDSERDFAAARNSLNAALALYRDCGNRLGEARVLNFLAIVCDALDSEREASALLGESLAIYESIGDLQGVAIVNYHIGFSHLKRRRWNESLAFSERARELWVQYGNLQGENWANYNIACAETGLGHPDEATRRHFACVSKAHEFGFQREFHSGLDRLGELLAKHDPRLAVHCFSRAAELRGINSHFVLEEEREAYEISMSEVRTSLSDRNFEAAWQEGRAIEADRILETLRRAISPRVPKHSIST